MPTDTNRNDSRPRVHLLDSEDTARFADEIIRGLDHLGVDATAPFPDGPGQVRAVIVLLSSGAIDDPAWLARVQAARGERLVPARIDKVNEADLPDFIRELNWVMYRPDDATFTARLFTGINTDASRYRDDRDTRALAERWEDANRSPDLLLESLGEVNRRIAGAAARGDGDDPLVPDEQVVQLAGSLRDRHRYISIQLAEPESNGLSRPMRLVALWLAVFRGTIDGMLVADGTSPVAFLAASRRHASRLLRQQVSRIAVRSVLAVVTIVAVVTAVVVIQQAVRKSNNAVSFAIGDIAENGRPDLAAIKAGASLIDSGTFPGDDGRFRIVADALSHHWAEGYLIAGPTAMQAAVVLADESVQALDYDGGLWTWDPSLSSRTHIELELSGATIFDATPDGELAVVSDGSTILVVDGTDTARIEGVNPTSVRIAPATDRLLVSSSGALWRIDGFSSKPGSPVELGQWDRVWDLIQTSDGRAAALVERDGLLQIVNDDGTIVDVGASPASLTAGVLSPDGLSIALSIDDRIWTAHAGSIVPSGIVVPGVLQALGITSDGLVLVSDRAQGAWIADPVLGIRLGAICEGMVGTTKFAPQKDGDRVLCFAGSLILVDSIDELRPLDVGVPVPASTDAVTSDGQVTSLSLVEGLIVLERADGGTFAFDAAGLSFAEGFVRPDEVAAADFFATGTLIQARNLPTTVAVTSDGNTFAIGFIDGRLIEVDVKANGSMAPVAAWQLPDHEAIRAIAWTDDDATITAITAAGTQWQRPSCSDCWNDGEFVERITQRAWLCYADGDIDSIGDSARSAFALRDCESQWGRAE